MDGTAAILSEARVASSSEPEPEPEPEDEDELMGTGIAVTDAGLRTLGDVSRGEVSSVLAAASSTEACSFWAFRQALRWDAERPGGGCGEGGTFCFCIEGTERGLAPRRVRPGPVFLHPWRSRMKASSLRLLRRVAG